MNYKMRYYFLIFLVSILSGCAMPGYVKHGRMLRESPDKCLQQAREYAKFLSKEGKTIKIMVRPAHAFCVVDGIVYDSTRMEYTGYSVDNWQVKDWYGDKDDWKCIEIWTKGEVR